MSKVKHIPALGFDNLTGFYDKVILLTMPEQRFRTALVQQAFSGNPKAKTLEFGVGTASNAILAKLHFPDIDITGVDVDSRVLDIAKDKIARLGLDIILEKYDGEVLPFADSSFETIISSLVFHHLLPETKLLVFKELYRVLRPEGKLVFADWGKPAGLYGKMSFSLLRAFDGWRNTADHATGNYHNMLMEAGFMQPQVLERFQTVYGTLELVTIKKKENE